MTGLQRSLGRGERAAYFITVYSPFVPVNKANSLFLIAGIIIIIAITIVIIIVIDSIVPCFLFCL